MIQKVLAAFVYCSTLLWAVGILLALWAVRDLRYCCRAFDIHPNQSCLSHHETHVLVEPLQISYEGCPESIQPFRISPEPVVWPWCNLAVSQRRPYCASVNSHHPVGLVSRQWDGVDWACVLCDRRIHSNWASRSASSRQFACPFYSSRAGIFWQSITSPRSVSPPTTQIWLPATSGFSQS
jgi:hypothetical protein